MLQPAKNMINSSVWSVGTGQSHPQWQWQGGTVGNGTGLWSLKFKIQPTPKAKPATAKWVSIRPPPRSLESEHGDFVHVPSSMSKLCQYIYTYVCIGIYGIYDKSQEDSQKPRSYEIRKRHKSQLQTPCNWDLFGSKIQQIAWKPDRKASKTQEMPIKKVNPLSSVKD
jgi:hypothetical protein